MEGISENRVRTGQAGRASSVDAIDVDELSDSDLAGVSAGVADPRARVRRRRAWERPLGSRSGWEEEAAAGPALDDVQYDGILGLALAHAVRG